MHKLYLCELCEQYQLHIFLVRSASYCELGLSQIAPRVCILVLFIIIVSYVDLCWFNKTIFLFRCVHPIYAKMSSIPMLLHFSQIVPRVCILVLFIIIVSYFIIIVSYFIIIVSYFIIIVSYFIIIVSYFIIIELFHYYCELFHYYCELFHYYCELCRFVHLMAAH